MIKILLSWFFCCVTISVFAQGQVFTGEASYYADKFIGKSTASGELYDPQKYTAASRNFPFHTIVKVTNLNNNQFVYVRINDKLPKKTRIIDLSRIAAEKLEMLKTGIAQVKVEYVEMGEAGKDPIQNFSSKLSVKKQVSSETNFEENEQDEDDESEEDEVHVSPPSKKSFPEKLPEKVTKKEFTSKYTNFEGKPEFPRGIGLQIASFKNESFAVKAAIRLHLQGHSNIIIEKYDSTSPTLYRLIAWGFNTEEQALQFGKKLEKLGYDVYFIYKFQE